ncbi:MAG: metallophosphoesterase [bacterium]|nr:metallophosphoesterase [bacterium]
MKILIFSDTHLTKVFDQKKFLYLKKIVQEVNKVIINGDFWDGYLSTFEEFINSPWKQLFPYLKDKKSVYIFGNHDKKEWSDKRINQFSDLQTDQFTLSLNKNTYIIEHGHRLNPSGNILLLLVKFEHILTGTYSVVKIFSSIQQLIINVFGVNFYKILRKRANSQIKRRFINNQDNKYYVFAHTHCAEIDFKNNFVNSGMIRLGIGQYILINKDEIKLNEESY